MVPLIFEKKKPIYKIGMGNINRLSQRNTPLFFRIPSIHQVSNEPFPYKKKYESAIPLKIFQTWGTKNITPEMKKAQEEMIAANPEFQYYFYDDNCCRNFIKAFFHPSVLQAFDKLIPGSYKADLWRCCILYVYGGIYLDMKFRLNNRFRLIELTENEHFTLERNGNWMPGKFGIYNAFMVSKPKNPFLKNCIEQIVFNVQSRYYGHNPLYPTGPGMMWLVHERNRQWIGPHINMFLAEDGNHIVYKNRCIMKKVDGYVNNNTVHYDKLYRAGQIYH
jgi:mannosyltransferase OCH1-like enzyme